jgi:hypothetical protein
LVFHLLLKLHLQPTDQFIALRLNLVLPFK